MKDFHIIKDFTIVITIFSAFLYALGYLNETAYLERFLLNNSELAPDFTTSITLGFRYLFLNTFAAALLITVFGPCFLFIFYSVQTEIYATISNSDTIVSIFKEILKFLKSDKVKFFLLICMPGVMVLTCLHTINKAKEKSDLFKTESYSNIEKILILSEGKLSTYSGKVVRIRDGLVLFWAPDDSISYIFPQKSVHSISYEKTKDLTSN